MPQILVTADGMEDVAVTLRERINVDDFDSERFAANLVERLGWAVLDAVEAERSDAAQPRRSDAAQTRQPRSASVVTTAS